MKHKTLVFFACLMLLGFTTAVAAPTMAGRIKSYGNGILVIERDDKTLQKFAISDKTKVTYMGRNTSVAALPVGAKISIEVVGSLGVSPLKAGRIVDWGNSNQIVATGAKAPYYTQVGSYATANGPGGVPDGAPVGKHSASQMVGAVAIGGSINAPTQQNTPLSSAPASNPNAYSTMGPSAQSTQYMNQGEAMSAPLQMMNLNPYGGEEQAVSGQSYTPYATGLSPSATGVAGGGTAVSGMGGPNAMSPAAPGMPGMDPSVALNNSYGQSNLGTGQATSLMGITGDDDDDYSAAGDMMGIGSSGVAAAGSKLTGNILEVNMQQGFFMLQSFTEPQPQRILMGVGSSCPTELLIPGKMVEVVGRPSANGFQAVEVRPAANF